jgi:hypothetical protein
MSLELDHLFFFVESQAQAEAWVSALGLSESYRRKHPGQGTENICCCFNNAYLEFLWVNNVDEVLSRQTAPLGFAARADWSLLGSAPIGIAVRSNVEPLPFETWDYRPDYLPDGVNIPMSIPVALGSEDGRQPLIFAPPMGARPDQWTGDRAVPINTAVLTAVEVLLPVGIEPSASLAQLETLGLVALSLGQMQWGLTLILDEGDAFPTELSLPIW